MNLSTHTPLQIVSETIDKVFNATEELTEEWQGIDSKSLQRFGIRTSQGGTYFPYYRHGGLSGFKVRKHDADHATRFFATGALTGVELFGQNLCSAHSDSLIITEGEKDAISAWQMTGVDSVSIPTGATIKKDGSGVIDQGVKDQEQFLRRYKTIYLSLDQDDPGKAVSRALSQWLGNTKVVNFPYKDVNDVLQAGETELYKKAIENASPYRPVEILTPRDLRDEMLKPVDKGMPYPWPTLNTLLGGIRPGEVVGWGAGVKIGKTNSAMELTEHLVKNQNTKVGLFYLENQPVSTMQIVTGKMLGDMSAAARNRNWTAQEVDEAVSILEDNVWIYNTRLGRDWNTIRGVMRWLAISEGVKVFFLDPLTALVPGDAGAANAFLMDFFKDITEMSMELGIHINYYSHLNPPKQGTPHEEGGRVQAIQFTGSRAMIRYSSAIIGLERNVIAEDPEIKNRTTMRVLLAREIGTTTGEFWSYYDEETGNFSETPHLKPIGDTQHVA